MKTTNKIKLTKIISGLIIALNIKQSTLASEPVQGPVFIIEATGGCYMGGPNCPRYELREDGSFSLFRVNEETVEKTADIDKEQVTQWMDLIETTDIPAMIARLGPGSCNSCFDGVDFKYEINTQSKSFTLESTKVDFFENHEPFFAQSEKILRIMMDSARLDIKKR